MNISLPSLDPSASLQAGDKYIFLRNFTLLTLPIQTWFVYAQTLCVVYNDCTSVCAFGLLTKQRCLYKALVSFAGAASIRERGTVNG
ncbi:hypothetical protein [Paenibacillus sp. NPDC055715]